MYSCAVIDKSSIADKQRDRQVNRETGSVPGANKTSHRTRCCTITGAPKQTLNLQHLAIENKLGFYIRNLNSWFYLILVMSNRLFQRGKTQNRYGHSKLAEMRLMIIIHTETMIILKANNVLYACFLFGPHLQLNSILIW